MKTPAATPGEVTALGIAALLITTGLMDDDTAVKLASVGAGALLTAVVVVCNTILRVARNRRSATETVMKGK